MTKDYYVYILATKKNGTLYVGVTSDIAGRVYTHSENIIDSFTKKYAVHRLVYFEVHEDIHEAILREKQIKKWRRDWKIRLIEEDNPQWLDLSFELNH